MQRLNILLEMYIFFLSAKLEMQEIKRLIFD